MAEFLLPKQIMRVRFPLPAPNRMNRGCKEIIFYYYSLTAFYFKKKSLIKRFKTQFFV